MRLRVPTLCFYSYYYLCPLPYVQRTYGKAKAKGIKIRKASSPYPFVFILIITFALCPMFNEHMVKQRQKE